MVVGDWRDHIAAEWSSIKTRKESSLLGFPYTNTNTKNLLAAGAGATRATPTGGCLAIAVAVGSGRLFSLVAVVLP